MNTHVAATPVVAVSSMPLDLGVAAEAPSQELQVGLWRCGTRLAVLIGGSAVLWAGLGWVAFQVLKLG